MNSIHVGFTGTRKGMSVNQKCCLVDILSGLTGFRAGRGLNNYVVHFHHGACEGADVEADLIARNHGCKMYIHPSNHKTRVYCEEPGDAVYPLFPPLVRDRKIVDVVEILIAAPLTDTEVRRSGTWTTVRYARKQKLIIEQMKR